MKQAAVVFLCVFAFAANVMANTGFFSGSGQTITLTKTEHVQLVSEEVVISPKIGFVIQGDSADYRCRFVLKNLSAKPVKIQVGFPLDSQFMRMDKDDRKSLDLVLDYHFIVRDEETTYHVRYVPCDSQKKFFHLFLWDMDFKPGERKVLHVAYELSMSMALRSTLTPEALEARERDNPRRAVPLGSTQPAKRPVKVDAPPARQPVKDDPPSDPETLWQACLENCIVEWFQYVTETGDSWAGPIEKATFQVETDGLVWALGQRAILPGDSRESMSTGVVYTHFSSEGGKHDPKDGTTTWEFRHFKPGKPLCFRYYLVPLPRTAADCNTWVRSILGTKPTKADVTAMREVVAAFYGIAPKPESAKKFVQRQVWYHPKKGLQEAGLNAEQLAVLKRLDAMAKGGR